jgi:soluble lytic murein transglycosylase-like protein
VSSTHLRRLVVAVLTVSLAGTAWARTPQPGYPYHGCFQAASRLHHVPVDLLLAVASIESALNPDARSNRNAHGIMQIQWPGTARHLGVRRLSELYNPCLNIELGARYLRELLDANKGDVQRALAAYNSGPGRIAASPSLPRGAAGYAAKVLSKQDSLKSLAASEEAHLTGTAGVPFDSRQRAERFARTLNDRISGARFAARKSTGGVWQVSMVVSEAGLSATDVSTLQALGWSNLGASG